MPRFQVYKRNEEAKSFRDNSIEVSGASVDELQAELVANVTLVHGDRLALRDVDSNEVIVLEYQDQPRFRRV